MAGLQQTSGSAKNEVCRASELQPANAFSHVTRNRSKHAAKATDVRSVKTRDG